MIVTLKQYYGLPITSIVLNVDRSWTFFWDVVDGATSYRVVLWGKLLAQVTEPHYTWIGREYISYPPPLEVMVNDKALSERFIPFFIMQWYGEDCLRYTVQQFIGTDWTTVADIVEQGKWIYSYQTPVLMDEKNYSYRVFAVDSIGNQSPPRQYARYVVCPPVSPDDTVAVTYNSTTRTLVVVAK